MIFLIKIFFIFYLCLNVIIIIIKYKCFYCWIEIIMSMSHWILIVPPFEILSLQFLINTEIRLWLSWIIRLDMFWFCLFHSIVNVQYLWTFWACSLSIHVNAWTHTYIHTHTHAYCQTQTQTYTTNTHTHIWTRTNVFWFYVFNGNSFSDGFELTLTKWFFILHFLMILIL